MLGCQYLKKRAFFSAILFFFGFLSFSCHPAQAGNFRTLDKLFGSNDAFLIADGNGKILHAKNETKPLIPASTLKLLTTLTAYHYLGKDFRFTTEFYTDKSGSLKIKGHGDPLLISEEVDKICRELASKIKTRGIQIKDLILDDTYFAQPLTIPGITSSFQPYDAPNGALCVNFNTVTFKRVPQTASFASAEPQTPLLPIALGRIKRSGLKQDRIVLSHNKHEILLYAGEMFRFFLEKYGVDITGQARPGQVDKQSDTLLLTYQSRFSMADVIRRLLKFSNNFMANQLLIRAGAEAYGPPGNLDKGVRAARTFAEKTLNLDNFHLREGSGISRENKISAKNMLKVLQAFFPYRHLMQSKNNTRFKTGTLDGISTLAGYIEKKDGKIYPFVIMRNSRGKSAMSLLPKLSAALD